MQQQAQQTQRQVLNSLNLKNINNQRPVTQKSQKVYDTQTVLQLIYQQQQINEQNQTQTQAQIQAAQRYKTELCRSFQENGICKYGDKCQFAHGSNELRTMSRHPKYKTELCRTFHANGYCPYGPRCHFVHDTQTDLTIKSANETSPKELTLKLNHLSSSSSSSSSSSTSPLSLNQFNFEFNNDLENLFPQNKTNNLQNSNNLLMYANDYQSEFNWKATRTESTSSSSVFSDSISPPSSRSLSPDFLYSGTQSTRKLYDDWDFSSADSIVNQILSNVVCLDNQTSECSNDLNDEFNINYLSLATSNLLI